MQPLTHRQKCFKGYIAVLTCKKLQPEICRQVPGRLVAEVSFVIFCKQNMLVNDDIWWFVGKKTPQLLCPQRNFLFVNCSLDNYHNDQVWCCHLPTLTHRFHLSSCTIHHSETLPNQYFPINVIQLFQLSCFYFQTNMTSPDSVLTFPEKKTWSGYQMNSHRWHNSFESSCFWYVCG